MLQLAIAYVATIIRLLASDELIYICSHSKNPYLRLDPSPQLLLVRWAAQLLLPSHKHFRQ